jgi:hypothetical protein
MDYSQFIILVGGAFNLCMVGLLIWSLHLRAARRARRFEILHEERMLAMQKGIPLPELSQIEDVMRGWPDRVAASDPRWALIAGVTGVFLGAGVISAAVTINSSDLWPLGLIPSFLGTGFLLLYGLLRHGRK